MGSPFANIARAFIPKPLRRFVRAQRTFLPEALRRFVGPQHRRFIFGRALTQFSRDPERLASNETAISELIYGWGNEAWAASKDYLQSCVETALGSRGPILECGSGLTTILLGIVAQRLGNVVWSLEHNSFWGERVQRYLGKYAIHSVRLCVDELRDYGDFSWYDPPLDIMPHNFSLVVCDGPPSDTRGGRYGLLPVMGDRLTGGCIVLLHDAQRAEERAILTRWAHELGVDYEVRGSDRAHARFIMPRTHLHRPDVRPPRS